MWSLLLIAAALSAARSKQIPISTDLSTTVASASSTSAPWPGPLVPADLLTVSCERDAMHITITLAANENAIDDSSSPPTFSGIVYPAGLGGASRCLRPYEGARGQLQYTLPLQGCNTMPRDHDDGTIEYYNNIIVQPHLELVTGQGRGYHVQCRYKKRDLTNFHALQQPRADRLTSGGSNKMYDDEYDEESGLLPSVTLKIYKGDPEDNQVASEVSVGEPLTMVVSLEQQHRYGALVAECAADDGLGDAAIPIIDDRGCPMDQFLMGGFEYSPDKLSARVTFPAHKFPHTDSIYYTCNVRLCDMKYNTECEPCSKSKRVRRQSEESPAKVEVFTGLYVNEADSLEDDEVTSKKKEDEICIPQQNFAIGICVAGVILMICVIAAIAFIMARRRSPKTYSRTGSSLYSGPYTNTGYSHTS